MTAEEFKQLENLFSKLCLELGGNPICILNGQIEDGWHIGIYEKAIIKDNKITGGREIGRNASGIDLKTAVETAKNQKA